MKKDIAFEMATSSIRFGHGVTREAGMDLVDMGVNRVMVITDPTLSALPPVATLLESLAGNGVAYELFDRVHVEPTDTSFQEAIAFAREGEFDGFVAIGGGSSIDTAKAANLYSTYPADLLTYVNAPIGKGEPVPGALKPLIAIPTTAGTGSETTGVAIFDLVEMKAKTGIAHRRLKPTLGLIDPDNTRTLPPAVAASTGLDVLCHAVESYTAIPFGERPLPQRPLLRPAYQGSNPISDLWAMESLRMVREYLPRAVADPDDEARGQMLLAASFAGIGFGNAGVHLPHGMSYPVAGMVRDFVPEGYGSDHPMVPHGIAVIVNAPAVFRFTATASPRRHLAAAEALGASPTSAAAESDAGAVLADTIIELMQRLNMPGGLAPLGYGSGDIPALVAGTLPQHRVTKLSPRPAGEEELSALFEDAMRYW
ncbi:MAG: hydroxyacid-oxoacid transhydrogenase [Candidatus Latescibacterota bacterium]|nr:hydroxyacid-oxoacid transhydrogenase [Candidatus Latescibacterota bacterium]